MHGSVASNRGLVKDVLDAKRCSFFGYELAQLFGAHAIKLAGFAVLNLLSRLFLT
jgi:hypothetical protein